jgi:hypothetical protein
VIYFTMPGGTGACLVIEPGNIDRLKRGEPIKSPDGNILICLVNDMPWFEQEFKAMLAIGGASIDPKIFDFLIREGMKRPEVKR